MKQNTYISSTVETEENDNLVSENMQSSDISENKTCMEPVASETESCRKESDLCEKETIQNIEGLKLDEETQREVYGKNGTRGAVQQIWIIYVLQIEYMFRVGNKDIKGSLT